MGAKSMFKLVKLEIKKFKLWNYWKAITLCNLLFIAFLNMIYFIEKSEGNIPFESFDMVASIIGAMVRITFTIFASVIIVKLIIDEYKNKTMDVLFSYPIKRKKIIRAKLSIVFTFTFVNVLFSTLFLEGLVYLTEMRFDILPGNIESEAILRNIMGALLTAIATAGISLIPLLFGLHRKSAPKIIISSVLIASILNSTNGDFTLFSFIAIPLSLCLFGLFIAFYSIRNIEKNDLV